MTPEVHGPISKVVTHISPSHTRGITDVAYTYLLRSTSVEAIERDLVTRTAHACRTLRDSWPSTKTMEQWDNERRMSSGAVRQKQKLELPPLKSLAPSSSLTAGSGGLAAYLIG